MAEKGINNKVTKSVTINIDREEAFDIFITHFSVWWPSAYTWSGDVLKEIVIEPKVDGRCYERGPFDFSCDWGRVLSFDPPGSLAFTWQISPSREPVPDPSKASEVEVSFVSDNAASTQLVLEHRAFHKHGEGWESYLEAMDSKQGWQWVLEQYQEYVVNMRRN
ncbi:hypothetical protein C900_03542 [Fulvivirga imtechensis AK7]|uniref:Activator of Hsp90 ATPase homologue 1/2-like C-terminal domain-containing protein n=1 Tax=Fulvivirga imtechensis AK7 TaxID=1237149 RepID=L8JNL8_9BACT|nr:SRPBCC family protein [Fulvivirga imtechensis]ELR70561.1 hypothetical protein C900_03542 [Fulvivirga imtechensis AK7]